MAASSADSSAVAGTSVTRTSRVGSLAEGRTSQKIVPGSTSAPQSVSAAMSRSKSATESKYGGGPATGHFPQVSVRQLAYPVSRPSQNGEFAMSAISTGSHGRTWLLTSNARSRSGRCTWTWPAHTLCSSCSARYVLMPSS